VAVPVDSIAAVTGDPLVSLVVSGESTAPDASEVGLSAGDMSPIVDSAQVKSAAAQAMREGRFAEASDLLETIVHASRDDGDAWRLLGGALSSSGDTDAAVVAFAEALRCHHEDVRSHYNLALALERAGRAIEAKQRYAACLALDPSHPGAHERLAAMALVVSEPSSPLERESTVGTGELSSAPATPSPADLERRLEPPVVFPRPDDAYAAPTTRASRWGDMGASPPPQSSTPGQQQRPLPRRPSASQDAELQSSTILALGIIGLAGGITCGLPLLVSPVAWVMANRSMERMRSMEDVDPAVRNQLNSGRTLGIVGTGLLVLTLLAIMAIVLVVALGQPR